MSDAKHAVPEPASTTGNDTRFGPAPGATPTGAVLDSDGLVASDVPCRRCSYNLRSLNVAARCPECNAPVGVSIHGQLLRYGDPGWVRDLGRGAGLMFWGILASVVLGLLAALLNLAFGPYVGQTVALLGSLIQLYGVWLLTAPDPSGIGEDEYGTARKVIRVALVVGLVANVIQIFNGSASAVTANSSRLTFVLVVVTVGGGLVGLVGQFAMLRYLEKLTLRIPDDKLSRRARVLFWGYGCSLAAMVLVGSAGAMVAVYASRATAPGASGGAVTFGAGTIGVVAAASIFAFAALVSMLVFGIVFLILLHRLQQVFAEQARFADYLWGKGEAGARVTQVAPPDPLQAAGAASRV
jgi:hypothetical protein